MKVLLVSDTHGRNLSLEDVLDIEKPDFLCHMGDIEGSEDYIRLITKCPPALIVRVYKSCFPYPLGNHSFGLVMLTERRASSSRQSFDIFLTSLPDFSLMV